MKQWIFKIYGYDVSDVDGWLAGLSKKARAKLDTIIDYMEATRDWTRTPYFSPLTGYSGIYEIKFIVQSKQYRPLGCYGPGNNEFTILIGAWEKGDRFKPINAPIIAFKRRQDVIERKVYTHDYC